MKNLIYALLAVTLFTACAKNHITGRKQLSLINDATMQGMAVQEYAQFLQQSKVVSSTDAQTAMVRRVGSRIANAITKYYTDKGLGSKFADYKWEYNLVDSKDVNAWCMPGGKIVVYTGILPVTQNEDALAVVMGHEIAHAIAEHGKERMSQGLIQQLGGVALAVAVSSKPQETQELYAQAFGVGSNLFGILPHSRKQELESDKLGLLYCALAGYNPQEAIPFWGRMSKLGSGQKPPEFLSTHPAEETRIAKLQAYMPEALKVYQASLQGK
jgi:predicted Zn-dependent protease